MEGRIVLTFCLIGFRSANDLQPPCSGGDYPWSMPGGTASEMMHVLIFSRSLLARRL